MGFASKFANKALLDQSRSKALMRRRLNGRATDLYPRKSKSFLRGINRRRNAGRRPRRRTDGTRC
jgi:hypothetical protein